MKKTWFHGLAFTLGIASIPGVASAQYTISNPGAGLAGSSYNVPARNSAGLPGYMAGPAVSPARYAQNQPVGSGLQVGNGHVHVPTPGSVLDNAILNSPYAAPATQGNMAQPQYEQLAPPPATMQQNVAPSYNQPYNSNQQYSAPAYNAPSPQSQYSAPSSNASQYSNPQYNAPQYAAPQYSAPSYPSSSAPTASGGSSCAACNSGSCSAHGTIAPSSSYTFSGDCYGTPVASYGPSILSPSPWFFGGGGLLFNRIDDNYVRLSYDSVNSPAQAVLSTSDARMVATGGFQTFGGRYFGDGRYAVMASYWGIFSNPQTATYMVPPGGNLRSNLPFTLRGPSGATPPYGITMPAQNVYDWYDGAQEHRLVRDQQFNNVEVNFFSFALGGGARQPYAGCGTGCGSGFGGIGGRRFAGNACGNACGDPCASACGVGGPTGPCAPWYGAQCSKLRLNMFGGVRWFQFKDSLEYGTSDDMVFDNSDFYYRNNVSNNLVGFQLGSLATWCTGTRLNLFAGTSFGVFGNHMTASTFAGTTVPATIMSTNSFNGNNFDYTSTRNDVAFLGEGNLGCGLRITQGWTANVGYRVVGVSGVASSVGQIPRDFTLANDVQKINNNNSLILHGLVLGAAYNF